VSQCLSISIHRCRFILQLHVMHLKSSSHFVDSRAYHKRTAPLCCHRLQDGVRNVATVVGGMMMMMGLNHGLNRQKGCQDAHGNTTH